MRRLRTFSDIERSVLAEVICWPERSLPLVADLELDDFQHPTHRGAWEAIRALQAAGLEIDILAVIDRMHDVAIARHGANAVSMTQIAGELAQVVNASPSYEKDHERRLQEHANELRAVTEQRRLLMGGA